MSVSVARRDRARLGPGLLGGAGRVAAWREAVAIGDGDECVGEEACLAGPPSSSEDVRDLSWSSGTHEPASKLGRSPAR